MGEHAWPWAAAASAVARISSACWTNRLTTHISATDVKYVKEIHETGRAGHPSNLS